jgi:hypothetical protein
MTENRGTLSIWLQTKPFGEVAISIKGDRFIFDSSLPCLPPSFYSPFDLQDNFINNMSAPINSTGLAERRIQSCSPSGMAPYIHSRYFLACTF